jgi:hypothetical protein
MLARHVRRCMLQDDCSGCGGRRRRGFFGAAAPALRRSVGAARRAQTKTPPRLGRDGVRVGCRRRGYLFLPAGFLAFALPADFATFVFFFAI